MRQRAGLGSIAGYLFLKGVGPGPCPSVFAAEIGLALCGLRVAGQNIRATGKLLSHGRERHRIGVLRSFASWRQIGKQGSEAFQQSV